MSAGLNDSPKFIAALGELVAEALNKHDAKGLTVMNGRQEAAPAMLAAAGD
jgi:hypothetical protein